MKRIKRIPLMLIIVFFAIVLATGLVYEIFVSPFREADNYPLLVDNGGSGNVTYHENKVGNEYCLAIMYISNVGDQPLTLDSVSLMESTNLEVLETSLMKIGEERSLPGFHHWPIVNTERYPHFDERIPAKGAIIQPGEGYNLMFVVRLLAENGSASGQELVYHNASGIRSVEKSYYGYAFNNDGMPTVQETQQLITQ